MPSKQTFCWCFGGRPPEIRYGIDAASPLKSMALEVPMPSDENELNTKFEELVAELDLDKPHRDALFNLPPEKKWQIYCSKTQVHPHLLQQTPPYMDHLYIMVNFSNIH